MDNGGSQGEIEGRKPEKKEKDSKSSQGEIEERKKEKEDRQQQTIVGLELNLSKLCEFSI